MGSAAGSETVSDSDSSSSSTGTVVLVPVKSFELAKGRLSDLLPPNERSRLARRLAAGVVAAAHPLPTYVVCDNTAVAEWATEVGVGVLRVEAVGLNSAVTEAIGMATALGHDRAIVSHADLPLAHDLTWLDDPPFDCNVVVVTDRHGTGTNVMALPLRLDPPFVFHYGPGSAAQHRAEAERLGLAVRTVDDERLGWDIDTPDDLTAWLAEEVDGAELDQGESKGIR